MKTITRENLPELEKWLDNLRESLISQASRGATILIKSSSRPKANPRVVDWQISVSGVRNENGVETDELMALA